jgi:hypothetical protein
MSYPPSSWPWCKASSFHLSHTLEAVRMSKDDSRTWSMRDLGVFGSFLKLQDCTSSFKGLVNMMIDVYSRQHDGRHSKKEESFRVANGRIKNMAKPLDHTLIVKDVFKYACLC